MLVNDRVKPVIFFLLSVPRGTKGKYKIIKNLYPNYRHLNVNLIYCYQYNFTISGGEQLDTNEPRKTTYATTYYNPTGHI